MSTRDKISVVVGIAIGMAFVALGVWASSAGVDRWLIRATTWALGAVGLAIVAWSSHRAVQAKRAGLSSGQEKLIGAEGVVSATCAPGGKVQFGLELWDAMPQASGSISRGDRVRVVSVKGRTLIVERAQPLGQGPLLAKQGEVAVHHRVSRSI